MVMNVEETRGFVLQALRQPGWSQIGDIMRSVGQLKANALGLSLSPMRFHVDASVHLEKGEGSLINEVVWSLIVENVLVPGFDDGNSQWPFLRLTEYGRRCVEENRILPHDPEGYLDTFRRTVLGADPTVEEYLTEALQCFLRNLHRASAVMLGAASEVMIFELFDAATNSVVDPNRKSALKTKFEKATMISKKYTVFEAHFASVKPSLRKGLTDNIDSLLRGVFDLIRNSRNDAGHPASGVFISRDVNYAHLKLFIPYAARVYALINWFNANQA